MTTASPASQGIPEGVFRRLREAEDTLMADVVRHVRTTYQTYSLVTDKELRSSFQQNLDISIQTARRAQPPEATTLERYARISRSRFEKGVLVDELIRAFRWSIGLIADQLTVILNDLGGSAELGVHAYRLIWRASDDYTSQLVSEYRRHQTRLDSQNREMKADILSRLQTGTVDEETLRVLSSRFQLSHDEPVYAFRAKPTDPALDVLDVMVQADTALVRARGFAAIKGDHVVGVCTIPMSISGPVAIAYGPRTLLTELPASFASAEAVLSTSMGRRPGSYRLEDVTWRAVVDPSDSLMPHLTRLFLEPLVRQVSDPSLLLHTVQAYLEADRSYDRASTRLHCHPNTVRYRITRFEQLTGVNINSTEHITSLMWFLEARARSG